MYGWSCEEPSRTPLIAGDTVMLTGRPIFGFRRGVDAAPTLDRTPNTAPRRRRKSRIASLSAILAVGAICLPLLASTTSAVAATPSTTPAIGKQLAELKGPVPMGALGTSGSTAVVGAPMRAAAYFAVSGRLNGVAAISASNAWAVGGTGFFTSTSMSLIAHWNGTAWKREPSPAPAHSILYSVAATSASNVWAVGGSGTDPNGKALILHWNGTSWKNVPSPSPAGSDLSGVAATSATNAWAVGSSGSGKTLILHWNGTSWKQVPSPSPGTDAALASVAATSARNAWAVGNAGPFKTLILHWTGKVWKRVPSPNPEIGNIERFLTGVAVTSVGNAWAVGGIVVGAAPPLP